MYSFKNNHPGFLIIGSDTLHRRYLINTLLDRKVPLIGVIFENTHIKPSFKTASVYAEKEKHFLMNEFKKYTRLDLDRVKHWNFSNANSESALKKIDSLEPVIGVVSGAGYLKKEVIKKFGKPAANVRGRVRAMNGEFSGGTAASMAATMSSLKTKPELFEILVNPFALSDGFTGPEQAQDSKPVYDEKLETWVAPFFMAPINTKNVHRSNVLMDHLYGEDFCYNEMWIQGPGEEGKAAAEFVASMNPLADAPAPGEGPSKESRDNGNYDVLFCADLADGSTIQAAVSGDLDPGYGSTSKMIAESAICLVKECPELVGGIYTPAPAMGEKLIARLQANAGLDFRFEK